MKKLFAIVLAVVMVLSVASMAMAFSWAADEGTTAEKFANRYKIEVVKLAKETGSYGSARYVDAPQATAVNGAPVYFAIRLTVAGAEKDPADRDAIQNNAKVDISFTALGNATLSALSGTYDVDTLTNGVYYFNTTAGRFDLITATAAAIEADCLDTATAKVYAKAYSERPLSPIFETNGYWVVATGGTVTFQDEKTAPENQVQFSRRSNGQVTDVKVTVGDSKGNFVYNLYAFLGITPGDIDAGKIFMNNANLRAALGFAYRGESSATWNANSTPIILDPTVTIPKTGDNASVIGFAMIMVAVVAAAVAVKKVKA